MSICLRCWQVEEDSNNAKWQRGAGSDFNSNQTFREKVQNARHDLTLIGILCMGGTLLVCFIVFGYGGISTVYRCNDFGKNTALTSAKS